MIHFGFKNVKNAVKMEDSAMSCNTPIILSYNVAPKDNPVYNQFMKIPIKKRAIILNIKCFQNILVFYDNFFQGIYH